MRSKPHPSIAGGTCFPRQLLSCREGFTLNTKRILALFLAVVTCLSLAASASAASISDFKDVDTKAWYAEAVSAAVDNGLLYGKSKTQLDPNGLLTRAEMAAITNRSFGCYTKI